MCTYVCDLPRYSLVCHDKSQWVKTGFCGPLACLPPQQETVEIQIFLTQKFCEYIVFIPFGTWKNTTVYIEGCYRSQWSRRIELIYRPIMPRNLIRMAQKATSRTQGKNLLWFQVRKSALWMRNARLGRTKRKHLERRVSWSGNFERQPAPPFKKGRMSGDSFLGTWRGQIELKGRDVSDKDDLW